MYYRAAKGCPPNKGSKMNIYQTTLPDGKVLIKKSTQNFMFAVAYLETDATEWAVISYHARYDLAAARKQTLWTRSTKGGKNASRNWLQNIQVVAVEKVAA